MYDPELSESYYEWIELYNPSNQSINLSGWSITDNSATDFFVPDFDHSNGSMIIPSNGYCIISDMGTKIYENLTLSNNTICVYVDDSSIGNGLGNSGDYLILKDNQSNIIDEIEWAEDNSLVIGMPAEDVKPGSSLCRYIGQDTNNSQNDFYEAKLPTMGYENYLLKEGNLKIHCDKKSYEIKKCEIINLSFEVENLGKYQDTVTIKPLLVTDSFDLNIDNDKITIDPGQTKVVKLTVESCKNNICTDGEIYIIAESSLENKASDELTISFEMYGIDLTIPKLKIYNQDKDEITFCGQGEIIKLKAYLKNLGKIDASDVTAKFYFDRVDQGHFLGSKYYETISSYQKYPSINWDTKDIAPGTHRIFITVDENNSIDELNEKNNIFYQDFKILDTNPDPIESKALITQVYFMPNPNLKNEYIKITNPTDTDINLNRWYLTNNPLEPANKQRKCIFSNSTILKAKSSLYFTKNSNDFFFETAKYADFEYNSFNLSNKGGVIALKDKFNHTIDLIVYGNKVYNFTGWQGKSVPISSQCHGLKRNEYSDTNSSKDWLEFTIGESDFSSKEIRFSGKIRPFVSPDGSYEAIVSEIRKANNSIYLNIYEFTNPYLSDELIFALVRNVSVNIFLDSSPVGGISSEEKFILNKIVKYGGNVRFIVNDQEKNVYKRYAFNHAKYLIIDNETTIVQSCNFANSGVPKDPSYGNREWGIIIKNSEIASYFMKIFNNDFNPERCDSYSYSEMNLSIIDNFFLNKYTYAGAYAGEYTTKYLSEQVIAKPVISPDNALDAIAKLIDSANSSIYMQQLYIYRNWTGRQNPLLDRLVNKSKKGLDIKIILNYNPEFSSTNIKNNETREFLESKGIKVKFIYSNWSYFKNIHNKGMIVDNKSVLISSVNWNENSLTKNREAGIIIENENISKFYAEVFFYDWNLTEQVEQIKETSIAPDVNNNIIYIVLIFTLTLAVIIRDWRKRQWT